jgi:hypothetical protein
MAGEQAEIQTEHLPNVTATPACPVLAAKENIKNYIRIKNTVRQTWRVLRFGKPDMC